LPIITDPVTQQRVLRMENSGDITYDLDVNTGSAIAMETVPVIGPWKDYTGSDLTINSKNQQMFGGVENQFDGTVAGVQSNENLDRLNIVGESASTTRRRIIKKYNAS